MSATCPAYRAAAALVLTAAVLIVWHNAAAGLIVFEDDDDPGLNEAQRTRFGGRAQHSVVAGHAALSM